MNYDRNRATSSNYICTHMGLGAAGLTNPQINKRKEPLHDMHNVALLFAILVFFDLRHGSCNLIYQQPKQIFAANRYKLYLFKDTPGIR